MWSKIWTDLHHPRKQTLQVPIDYALANQTMRSEVENKETVVSAAEGDTYRTYGSIETLDAGPVATTGDFVSRASRNRSSTSALPERMTGQNDYRGRKSCGNGI